MSRRRLGLGLVWTGLVVLTLTACSQRKYIGGSCAENAAVEIIDDMENGGDWHFVGYGFGGNWFCFFDKSISTNDPQPCRDQSDQKFPAQRILDDDGSPSLRGSSQYARHLWSTDSLVGWGAGLGFNLDDTRPFDASAWTGVRFYARSKAGQEQSLRMHIPDWHTSPQGQCDSAAGARCDRNFGRSVSLTSEWQEFSFHWAELEQPAFPGEAFPAIASDQIIGVRFQVDTLAGVGGPYDFWVDDVSFLCEP